MMIPATINSLRRFEVKSISVYLSLVIIAAIGMPSAFGQTVPRPDREGAEIRHADPGEITIRVNMWGDIRTPGRYIVPENIDLIELLTIAGGAAFTPQRADVDRTVYLNISRGAGGNKQVIYRERLDQIIGEGLSYPSLQNEDIVFIESRDRLRTRTREIIQIMGSVASLIFLIDRAVTVIRD